MDTTVWKPGRLPADIARELEVTSREDDRSQNGQMVHLLRLGLAGRRRLKELEALAAGAVDVNAISRSAGAAAADHLRAHRRLTGAEETSADG